MNTKSFEYILCVNECKSISKAAEKLFISQPTLSQHIQKLEKDLCIELFDRTSSPISLTYAGERFGKYALRILNLEKQLLQELKDINELYIGRLTIGISSLQGNSLLPLILPKYKEMFPGVKVVVVEENAKKLEELAEKGIVDIIILNLPIERKNLDYEILYLDQVLLAIPENLLPSYIDRSFTNENNNFINERININELNDCHFLLQRPGHRVRQIADTIFKNSNIKPNIYLESINVESLYKLTSKGMGITFMPKSFANKYNGLEYKRSQPFPVYLFPLNSEIGNFSLVVAYSTYRHLSILSKEFISLLHKMYEHFC